MKLGLLTYGLDRPMTGISRYTVELAKALLAEMDPADITLLNAGEPMSWTDLSHFNSKPLIGCSRLSGLLSIGQVIIPAISRRCGLGIVHDPSGVTPFAFNFGDARIVVTVHDAFPWTCPQTCTWTEKIIYRQWLPRILPKADAVITVSDHSRNAITKYLGVSRKQIHVIPYGVSSMFRRWETARARDHVRERLGIRAPFILFVGALTVRKNIERALRAFASIKDQIPATRFVLTGPKTGLPTPIDRIIDDLEIRDRVTLTGPLTDLDLPALFSLAEVFIFPSMCEGFGLPPLEAMACGAPVVCSNTTALPEVVGDAAIKIDPYSVSDIADAMLSVLTDSDLGEDLRRRGMLRAKSFTWKRTAQLTLDVYSKVLNE